MATLNDYNYTDNVHDVLAVYVNRLLATTLRSEYKNVQALSGDMELTDGDTPIQRLDCNGSDRDVMMPDPDAVGNHPFWIVNASDGGETITVKSNDETDTLGTISAGKARLFLPDGAGGYMAVGGGDVTPYRIAVSVTSNNLTLALKNEDGNDPSVSSPVRVQIGDTVREITAALSVTVNAAVNTFNAGSAELATREIDYFPMLAWVSASSVVAIGYSRIPSGRIGSDFSGTATNERYAAWSTAPGASDPVQVIGRFAATLSAGAGFTWSLPTFTAANLIHEPIYTTRWLTWLPYSGSASSHGFTSIPSSGLYIYQVDKSNLTVLHRDASNGISNANTFTVTAPMSAVTLTNLLVSSIGARIDNGNAGAGAASIASGTNTIQFYPNGFPAGSTSWTTTGNKRMVTVGLTYPIS